LPKQPPRREMPIPRTFLSYLRVPNKGDLTRSTPQ
jgi:hypothetical protein